MKLVSLLERLEYTCLQGTTDQEVNFMKSIRIDDSQNKN